MARLSELRGQYVQSFGRMAQLVDANDHEAATALLQAETLPALDALQQPINALLALQKNWSKSTATPWSATSAARIP